MAIYRLAALLPLSYTFTGENRNAFITLADDTDLPLLPMAANGMDGNAVLASFVASNVTFVRARLVASGAPGLEPAVGQIAGMLTLRFNDTTKYSQAFRLSFMKWNEWERQMVETGTGECAGGSIGLELIAHGTEVSLDDYNVQEAYVGQEMNAILELEVECNGINLV